MVHDPSSSILISHSYFSANALIFLPPGPINSPRIEAIEAALKPADTNYLYMVMNGRLGRHLFADDLAGHNKNRKKK